MEINFVELYDTQRTIFVLNKCGNMISLHTTSLLKCFYNVTVKICYLKITTQHRQKQQKHKVHTDFNECFLSTIYTNKIFVS